MEIWCKDCEKHTEYANLILEPDSTGRYWIDIICLDCNTIAASFSAERDEIKIDIIKADDYGNIS